MNLSVTITAFWQNIFGFMNQYTRKARIICMSAAAEKYLPLLAPILCYSPCNQAIITTHPEHVTQAIITTHPVRVTQVIITTQPVTPAIISTHTVTTAKITTHPVTQQ